MILRDLCQQWFLPLKWVGPLVFRESEVEHLPQAVSGVYLLHGVSIEHGGYPVFYVGQSTDVRTRLKQHLSPSQAKGIITAARRLGDTFFSAAPLPLELLDPVEAGLVHMLRPVGNAQIPTARPVLVNLPPLHIQSLESIDV